MSLSRDLERVLGLVAKAAPGEWRWSENGNILGHMPDGYDDSREVCAVYTDDEATGAPNAPAIIAAINFLRAHAQALRRVAEDTCPTCSKPTQLLPIQMCQCATLRYPDGN